MWRWLILAQTSDLSFLRMNQGQEASASNQVVLLVMLIVALVLVAVSAVFYVRSRTESSRLARQRQQARMKALITDLDLSDEDAALLRTITAGGTMATFIAAMETRGAFENSIRKFREAHPEDPALRKTIQLRQRLGFGFGNARNPFLDSRMLPVGTKLQCRMDLPKRSVMFLTVIVASNEMQFAIRPPRAKGKAARMTRFHTLSFRVTRDQVAEYEFTCKVLGQAPGGMQAVLMEHADRVRRLLFRNAPRTNVDIPADFYVVRQDTVKESSMALVRTRDSQFVLQGRVLDLSIGGALITTIKGEHNPRAGDMVIFRLPVIQMRDELVAQVVGVVTRSPVEQAYHLQFTGMKELDRLKLNRFLASQPAAPPPSQPAPEAEAAPAGDDPAEQAPASAS